MRVLITGPESSGTSFVTRIFREAGADVVHRSATYAGDYPAMRPVANHEVDAVIVLFRDPFCTMASQNWAADPWQKLQKGYHEIFRALADIDTPIYVLPYEAILRSVSSLQRVLYYLGLDADAVYCEEIRDENEKHYRAKRKKSSVPPVKPAQPKTAKLGYALGPGIVFPYPEEA